MDMLLNHRIELVSLGVALVAIGAASAYFLLSKKPKGSLDPERFKDFQLVKRTQLSHNVANFRFSLPTPTSVLGLPIGQHMSCRGKDALGEQVIKPYTPTTLDSDVGFFELVIKGRFRYQQGQVRAFGMLAGGSGITPMFQVARAILEDPKDCTKLDLIYANVTFEDILLKEKLDTLSSNYPGRFKVYYVLNQALLSVLCSQMSVVFHEFCGGLVYQPPEGWNGGVGFVSKEMIQEHCPAPADDIKVLRCGPPPMNKAMAAHLDALGYSSEMQFQF
ncbi:hypothetical protein Syun_002792 [Stephania yunnanensis]|uniref:cytochrome-b5 reductase n=1 Tax=Stephania yunnanensis TaxID=152371 RepID=A0AAP0LG05_9MAGN